MALRLTAADNQFLQISDKAVFTIELDIVVIGFFVRFRNTVVAGLPIVSQYEWSPASNNRSWQFSTPAGDATNMLFRASSDGTIGNLHGYDTTGAGLAPDTWYHFGIEYARIPNDLKLFIDGVDMATGALVGALGNVFNGVADLNVGARNSGGDIGNDIDVERFFIDVQSWPAPLPPWNDLKNGVNPSTAFGYEPSGGNWPLAVDGMDEANGNTLILEHGTGTITSVTGPFPPGGGNFSVPHHIMEM